MASLEENSASIKDLVKRINEPQSLSSNLKQLNDAGGVKSLLKLVSTHADHGITEDSIDSRRELFGSNKLPSSPRQTFWQLFVDTFDDVTLQILLVAAIVSLVIGIYDDPEVGYVEGMAILAA